MIQLRLKFLSILMLKSREKLGIKETLTSNKKPRVSTKQHMKNVVLTDLDSPRDCPPGLVYSWIKGPLNPRFLFRVAVMEVESWVMADRAGFAAFLSIPLHRIPSPTDDILNPKEFLVSLARKSQKKRVREALERSKRICWN